MSQIKKFWRSKGELEDTEAYKSFLHREFQEGASEITDVSRRSFLKLMGASAALAGVAGCGIRKPSQKIRPYAKRPEDYIPGKAVYYATTFCDGFDVRGVLAETHEGRPTKLEGNPLTLNKGKLSAQDQAQVLSLYDPDRLFYPKQQYDGQFLRKDWADVNNFFSEIKNDLSSGKKTVVISEKKLSSTYYDLQSKIESKFRNVEFFQLQPFLNDNQILGLKEIVGKFVLPKYSFSKADIVVSIASDFLASGANYLEHASDFSERRDPDVGDMNRLYAFESNVSVTGAKADHRYRVKPSLVEPVLWKVLYYLSAKVAVPYGIKELINKAVKPYSDTLPSNDIKVMVEDLIEHRGKSLIVAGESQSVSTHALVHYINTLLGNVNKTVSYVSLPFSQYKQMTRSFADQVEGLKSLLGTGGVNVVILGGNPVLETAGLIDLGQLLSKSGKVVHLTDSKNETSTFADLIIPKAHALESWDDISSASADFSLVQPLIKPLYDGKNDNEVLSMLLGIGESAYALLRKTLKNALSFDESQFKKWLHNGFIEGSKPKVESVVGASVDKLERLLLNAISVNRSSVSLELVITPSYGIDRGQFANNGWLLELPDPITKITWDNPLLISPKTAKEFNVKSQDMVILSVNKVDVKLPVLILPGLADGFVAAAAGFGRKEVGRVGEGAGFDVYPVFTGVEYQTVTLSVTPETYILATTQEHGSMEGREIYREGNLDQYKKNPKFAAEMVHTMPKKSLWQERQYNEGYQWGMVIDLSKCTGCNACITACQSENNIPIVGKEQVLKGREMHWIRLDRYFEGSEEDAKVVTMPVTCLQCENAPCEQVCPVAATVHSNEGLNDMVYNRCIGTRYCSNNCPVKVRRFNFFDFHQTNPQSVKKNRVHLFDYFREPDKQVQKQFNPDVTVRMRGVMEKCTFCTQRINSARILAKNEKRTIRDGDIVTACEQSCPSNAIVFGNIRDENSRVSKKKKIGRDYNLLDELYLSPRLTYAASIMNPNPKLIEVKEESEDHGHH